MSRISRYRKTAVVVTLAVAGLTGVSVALAQSDGQTTQTQREAAGTPPSSAVLAKFSVFQRSISQADEDGASQLASAYADPPSDYIISQTDWSEARSAPIQGSTARAWLAPAGSRVCMFIPTPNTGNPAGSCVGLDVINQGLGFAVSIPKVNSASGGTPEAASFGVLVPDGTAGPKVEDPSGNRTIIEPHNNIAAAVVSSTDTLIIGGRRVALAVDMSKFHMVEPNK